LDPERPRTHLKVHREPADGPYVHSRPVGVYAELRVPRTAGASKCAFTSLVRAVHLAFKIGF